MNRLDRQVFGNKCGHWRVWIEARAESLAFCGEHLDSACTFSWLRFISIIWNWEIIAKSISILQKHNNTWNKSTMQHRKLTWMHICITPIKHHTIQKVFNTEHNLRYDTKGWSHPFLSGWYTPLLYKCLQRLWPAICNSHKNDLDIIWETIRILARFLRNGHHICQISVSLKWRNGLRVCVWLFIDWSDSTRN